MEGGRAVSGQTDSPAGRQAGGPYDTYMRTLKYIYTYITIHAYIYYNTYIRILQYIHAYVYIYLLPGPVSGADTMGDAATRFCHIVWQNTHQPLLAAMTIVAVEVGS